MRMGTWEVRKICGCHLAKSPFHCVALSRSFSRATQKPCLSPRSLRTVWRAWRVILISGYTAASASYIATVYLLLASTLTMAAVIVSYVVQRSPRRRAAVRRRVRPDDETRKQEPNQWSVSFALSDWQGILSFLLVGIVLLAHWLGDDTLSTMCKDMFLALCGPTVSLQIQTIAINLTIGSARERDGTIQ